MLNIQAIDAISVAALFLLYIRGLEAAKEYQRLDAAGIEADKKQEQAIQQGKCTPALEKAYKDYKDSISAEYFRAFWISPRSFPVALAGATISLILGWSSLPGLALGFIVSSPKSTGFGILFFSQFSDTKTKCN